MTSTDFWPFLIDLHNFNRWLVIDFEYKIADAEMKIWTRKNVSIFFTIFVYENRRDIFHTYILHLFNILIIYTIYME